MSVVGVASVYAEMTLLQIVRDGGVVGITDGTAGHMFDRAQAQALQRLLERSLSGERGVGVMGSIATLDGQRLHVKRNAAGITVHDRTPADHGLWSLRVRDQVESLRDAIATAIGDTSEQATLISAGEPTAVPQHVELPEPTARPLVTRSFAPTARRHGAA